MSEEPSVQQQPETQTPLTMPCHRCGKTWDEIDLLTCQPWGIAVPSILCPECRKQQHTGWFYNAEWATSVDARRALHPVYRVQCRISYYHADKPLHTVGDVVQEIQEQFLAGASEIVVVFGDDAVWSVGCGRHVETALEQARAAADADASEPQGNEPEMAPVPQAA